MDEQSGDAGTERLPRSLVLALKTNGVDPRAVSVASAEAWSPESDVDLGSVDEDRETRALVALTLRRMCERIPLDLDERAAFDGVVAAIEDDERLDITSNDLALAD
jgi:hypothetical protein